jgi:hypothetical protein
MQLIILMWYIYSLKSLITHVYVRINLYYTNTRVYSYNTNFLLLATLEYAQSFMVTMKSEVLANVCYDF